MRIRFRTETLMILLATPLANGEERVGVSLIEELEVSEVTAMRQSIYWLEAPYSIEQLDKRELDKKLIRNFTESLSGLPGVMVQKTANGHGSPYLRGFTGYRTLMLIDGVRYNNSVFRDGPNEYFSLIDLNAIERTELLQGPSSVVYGNDAIGGALNLITTGTMLKEREGSYTAGKVDYRYSSAEQSHQERVEFELGEGGKWGLKLGLSASQYGDVKAADIGTQQKTGYDEFAFDVRFDRVLNDHWNLTLAHQELTQDDVWRTHSTIYSESFSGTALGTDLRRLKDQHRSLTYIKLRGEDVSLFADAMELTFSYQRWDEDGERVRSSGVRNEEYFDSSMFGVDLQLEKESERLSVVYGLDAYYDSIDSGRTDYNADGSIDEVRVQGPVGDDASYLQAGLYAQATWKWTDRLDILVGSRFSYVKADIGSYEDPASGDAASYKNDWSTFVNSVKLSYALVEDQSARGFAGLSQSFRAPNIGDLSRYGGSRSDELEVAATSLDPENFLTAEVGLKVERENYDLTAIYHYTLMDDYITSSATGRTIDGLTEVTKQNSAEGFVQGVELSGKYYLSDAWTLWANATWLEGELDVYTATRVTEPTREPLSRIMPLTLNVGANWKSEDEKIWAGVDMQWADKADKLSSRDQSDTQRIPPGGTPSYTRVNVYAGCQVNEQWSVNLALNNLFDKAYRIHGSGSNEPGFGVNLGVSATF